MSNYTEVRVHKNLILQLNSALWAKYTRPEGETRKVKVNHLRDPVGDACDLPFRCLGDVAKILPVDLFKHFDNLMSSKLSALYATIAIDIIHHKTGMCYNQVFVNTICPTDFVVHLTECELICIEGKITAISDYVKAILKKLLMEYMESSFLEIKKDALTEVIRCYNDSKKAIWDEPDGWFIGEIIRNLVSPFYYAKIIYRHSFHRAIEDDVVPLLNVSTLACSRFERIINDLKSSKSSDVYRLLDKTSIRRLPIKASLTIVSTRICTYGEFKEVHDVFDIFDMHLSNHIRGVLNGKALSILYMKFLDDLSKTHVFRKWLDVSFNYE
jgi:hypothetical protein